MKVMKISDCVSEILPAGTISSGHSGFLLILCCIHENQSHGIIKGNPGANKNSCQPVYLFSGSNKQDTSHRLCVDRVIFNMKISIVKIRCV